MRWDIGKNIHHTVVVVTAVASSFQEQLPSVLHSTISRSSLSVIKKQAGSAERDEVRDTVATTHHSSNIHRTWTRQYQSNQYGDVGDCVQVSYETSILFVPI